MNSEAESCSLKEELEAKNAQIKMLQKKLQAKDSNEENVFREIERLRKLQTKQTEPSPEKREEKVATTPDRTLAMFVSDDPPMFVSPNQSLPARPLSEELASASPIGGEDSGIISTPVVPEADISAEHASTISQSEPDEPEPLQSTTDCIGDVLMEDAARVSENHISMSDGKSREENPDEMQEIEGHPLTARPQQLCISRETVALNDGRQTVTIDSHGKVDNSAHPSSLPAAGDDGLDLLPNPVAPLAAGYISSESPAPTTLGCGVTPMPDAGNPTVENVTSTRHAQDLDASTIEVVTSIPLVPNADASAMENNGLTQPEVPQHTVADVTSDVSVENTTTSPLPSPIKKLCSAIDIAISMSSLGTTLSPRKDVRDLALEPAALQHGNVLGDFSDGVKNNDGENDSIRPAPDSLPSVEVSKEDESNEITDDRSSNRNLSLPGLPPTSDEECRKDSDIRPDASTELRTQPKETSPLTDGIDRQQSIVATGGTNEPSMNLPLQPSSSPRRDGSSDGGNEHSLVAPEQVDKVPSAELRTQPGETSPRANRPQSDVAMGGTNLPLQPSSSPRRDGSGDGGNEHRPLVASEQVNNAPPLNTLIPKPTSQGPGERSDPTSTTITSTSELTREETIRQSYTKYGLADILSQCIPHQPDLTQSPYDPNVVVLGHSQWEKRSVLNDDDIAKLPGQLKEITKSIREKNDKQLKRKLQGNFKLPKVDYSGTQIEILIAMAHREHAKATESEYEQTLADIRHFSILLVIRYIHGQKRGTQTVPL